MKRNAQKDITRCICDFNPGIGDFICCDKCSVWQHMRCMGVHPNRVPKVYECEQCNPRTLDKEAAVRLQLLLREEESTSSDEDEPGQQQPRKANTAKRARKASSNSVKSEESTTDYEDRVDYRRTYKEVKENMYSPSIKHRLEPRTEGLPSFGNSPPGVARVQPQAAGGCNTPARIQYPAMLHLLNHGPSKIVVTRQTLKPGTFISDYMGHFKQLSEYYEEIGGKSTLLRRPMNYVLHYPLLDICVDTREYGNIARFMRRSCHPNAQAKSYIQEGKLHIGIYALELITPNSEITIGFNFPVDHYQYTHTCSCSSPGCLVIKNNETLTTRAKKPFSRTNSMESTNSEHRDEEHKKQRLSREEVKMQNYIQVFEKIEREEERKRVLSENTLLQHTKHKSPNPVVCSVSPNRDTGDPAEDTTTPSRANKRRRKGSGKKARKGSGGSIIAGTKSPEHFTTHTTQHFTFEASSGVRSPPHIPATPPHIPATPPPTGPAYLLTEPVLTKHHVQYNGYEADIQLRPINTAPSTRSRRNFQLRNNSSFITPIKVQKDGFIVPIHGSLLNYKTKSGVAVYKTTKKRWLENFIRDGVTGKCPSPVTSPKPDLSPSREINTPEKEMPSPLPQAATRETEGLEAATRTLHLSDDTLLPPVPAIQPVDKMETVELNQPSVEVDPPVVSSSLSVDSFPVATTLSLESPTVTSPAVTMVTAVTMEKKKRVSLADYRKRLQSRSSKPNSVSNETQPVSPRTRPVFEPISPGPPEKESSPQSVLLEEFARPSLSETLSDESINRAHHESINRAHHSHELNESINPSKIRKIDYSSCSPSDREETVSSSESVERVLNGTPHTLTSPSHALSHDTFSKIKEILSQSNPGLVSSRNLNVSLPLLKTNLTMYDPNGSSVKQYQFPSQYSDEMWDTKRLKPSPSDYTAKFYKENDKR